ncbi:hypothetical protein ANN_13500 [Periplaneta americana]|uniref:Uncharacterized protein n=1 Tax=Periplaneta americana TaxID=6978 RepID=A0ABQ8TK12_PERAM|nr:hypothetical protein ANN_13500 [Periplaneta americana]
MSSTSSTESYPAFAHIELRENPGKKLNQVTCPDRESNPGHLVSRPDALTKRAKKAQPLVFTVERAEAGGDIGMRPDEPREFNLPTFPQRRITFVPEKLPGKYGVHSEEDCVKHVVQRCHIAQLHDGLKRSGKVLLHRYQREGDDFLGRIVAMDETWTRSYEPNLKRQSNEWKHPGSPRPKKVRPTKSSVKEMFIVAYEIDGVILHHAVPPRLTENADYWNIHRTHPI